METFSALLALCSGNPPITGGFPSQSTVTRSFDVFFDLRLNKRLSIQSRRRCFETPCGSLWRHCNAYSRRWMCVQRTGIERGVYIWTNKELSKWLCWILQTIWSWKLSQNFHFYYKSCIPLGRPRCLLVHPCESSICPRNSHTGKTSVRVKGVQIRRFNQCPRFVILKTCIVISQAPSARLW